MNQSLYDIYTYSTIVQCALYIYIYIQSWGIQVYKCTIYVQFTLIVKISNHSSLENEVEYILYIIEVYCQVELYVYSISKFLSLSMAK